MIVLTSNSDYNLWFYLLSYGFATIALITVQMIVNDREDRIEALKGLGKANPFVAFVAVTALLALAGVPPLMGFFGNAIATNPALIVVALLNSGIGIYYYLRTIVVILQKPESENGIEQSEFKTTPLQLIVLGICALALIFGGALLM
jgi:NADH-quinone oxidoreductase subunit N